MSPRRPQMPFEGSALARMQIRKIVVSAWCDLLRHQIGTPEVRKYDAPIHALLRTTLDKLVATDGTLESIAEALGAMATAALREQESEQNRDNASKARKPKDAVLTMYDEWGGDCMVKEKREEFMEEAMRRFGIKQRRTINNYIHHR